MRLHTASFGNSYAVIFSSDANALLNRYVARLKWFKLSNCIDTNTRCIDETAMQFPVSDAIAFSTLLKVDVCYLLICLFFAATSYFICIRKEFQLFFNFMCITWTRINRGSLKGLHAHWIFSICILKTSHEVLSW